MKSSLQATDEKAKPSTGQNDSEDTSQCPLRADFVAKVGGVDGLAAI
jgi:hypothetical protein